MAVRLSITLTQGSQSVANNQTYVTARVYAHTDYGSWNGYSRPGTLVLDGTSYSFSSTFAKNTTTLLFAASKWVTHNTVGAKTVSASASFSTGVSSGTVSASASLPLTTIPRATQPSLPIDSTALGAAVVISMPRASSSFTHTLTYSIGSVSGTIGTGLGTSVSWTPPLSLANQITTATSGKVTITCKTYSGSTLIGTKTVQLTVTIPASVVPTIKSILATEAVTVVTTAFGNRFVKTLSQLNIQIEAVGIYGSTIKSYKTTLDGVNYVAQSFTSNAVNMAGTVPVEVTVTDSRGRTSAMTKNVTVVDYAPPTIISMDYYLCDADGTRNSSGNCTKILISGVVSPVEEQNSRALKLKYKAVAEEVYTERVLALDGWTFEVGEIINNTDPTITYEYIAELTDKISTTTYSITTGLTVISRLAGGGGVALFEEAAEQGFKVGGGKPATFSGDVLLDVDQAFIDQWSSVFGMGGGSTPT